MASSDLILLTALDGTRWKNLADRWKPPVYGLTLDMAIDPGTGLAILGSAAGGAKVIEKILGPTAEYVGAGLKNWTERRVENVARIFRKASDKLGGELNKPGSVPPKVLKEVLEEGSYSDDELTAEYFGGILASGRTPNGRDDRAASYLRLTAELSTYQIRFHYIAYTVIRRLFRDSGLRTTFAEDVTKMAVHFPSDVIFKAMDFTKNERPEDIMIETTSALRRHDLLTCPAWGSAEHINENCRRVWPTSWIDVDTSGMVIEPKQFGMDYYLWGSGAGNLNRFYFLTDDFQTTELPVVEIPAGAVRVHKHSAAKVR